MSHALHPAQIALLNEQVSLPILARASVNFAVIVTKWTTLRRTRKALLKLDTIQLNDIGLTRAQAHAEAAKPFWQA